MADTKLERRKGRLERRKGRLDYFARLLEENGFNNMADELRSLQKEEIHVFFDLLRRWLL